MRKSPAAAQRFRRVDGIDPDAVRRWIAAIDVDPLLEPADDAAHHAEHQAMLCFVMKQEGLDAAAEFIGVEQSNEMHAGDSSTLWRPL